MPRFTIAALISADTGLGASGWARGSHACSGTSPHLEPKPTSVNTRTSVRVADGIVPVFAIRAVNVSAPRADADHTSKPTSNARNPSCVITAYSSPAARTLGSRWELSTSTSELTAINSQPSRNVVIDPASATSNIAATNTGSSSNEIRGSRSRCRYPAVKTPTATATAPNTIPPVPISAVPNPTGHATARPCAPSTSTSCACDGALNTAVDVTV